MSRFHDFMRRLCRHVPAFLPTAIVLGAILWLTLAPHPVGEIAVPWFEGEDKVVHGLMFLALTLTALFDIRRMRGGEALGLPIISMAVVASGIVGCIIELLQKNMGLGRSMDFLDAVADCFGAVVGGIIWIVAERKRLNQ